MFSLLLLLLAGVGQEATPPPPGPNWARRPDPSDLERYYPARAREYLVNGRATIECVIEADGRLSACRTVSETPIGWGFGEATVRASSKFRMRLTTIDGEPAAGTMVRVPLVWSAGNRIPLLCTDQPVELRVCAINPSGDIATLQRRGLDVLALAAAADVEPSDRERRPAEDGYFIWWIEIDTPFEDCPTFDGRPLCGGPPAAQTN